MTAPSKLPAAVAITATDVFAVSQGCTGAPPSATCSGTNGATAAQVKTWAQSGLGAGAFNVGFFGQTITGIDLHTAGDAAHFALPASVNTFAIQLAMVWNASAPTGSVTWAIYSGPGATGTLLATSATATTFGSGAAYTTIGAATNLVNGRDAYLNISSPNSVALTANVTLFYRQLA